MKKTETPAKVSIPLWWHDNPHFLGLILPEPSGYLWTNQVGGTMCAHPDLEGIFIPLPAEWKAAEIADPLFNVYPNESDGPGAVAKFLEAYEHLNNALLPAPDFYPEFCEAWIPVQVRAGLENSLLEPFAGRLGILTYSNSD